MNRALFLIGAFAALAACGDGQPFTFGNATGGGGGGTTGSGGDTPVPDNIARNLSRVSGSPGGATFDVDVTGLDAGGELVSFARNPALDVPGYVAYSYQDDPLDRFFVAMVQTSDDNAVAGAAVIDGGQFTEYYGGVFYEQLERYSPNSGQVSYGGAYVGLTNIGFFGPELLVVPGGTDPAQRPAQPAIIEADIFLNANFESDALVNGTVFNRVLLDIDGDPDTPGFQVANLPDIFLTGAVIQTDGSFTSGVELGDRTNVGTYAGVFGGSGATSVAGGLFLDGDWWDVLDDENEIGLFVLNRCGSGGDPTICAGAN